jgi:predicted HAD superfamily Cof-like phosphohydrolase
MSIDVEQAVRAFMQVAGQGEDHGKYSVDLRIRLIDEEYDELIEAINNRDRVQIAKELADLVYVVVGTAITMGIPFNEVFGALQISNMSKFDGEPEFREDGKVLKGKNFKPAETAIRDILRG